MRGCNEPSVVGCGRPVYGIYLLAVASDLVSAFQAVFARLLVLFMVNESLLLLLLGLLLFISLGQAPNENDTIFRESGNPRPRLRELNLPHLILMSR